MDKLIENIARYLEARIELLKLDLQQQISGALVKIITFGLTFFLVPFVILFVSVGIANVLNDAIGNPYIGYFIVAGFYLALVVVIFALRGVIQSKVEEITNNLFAKKNGDKQVEVVTTSDNGVAEPNYSKVDH